MTTNRKITVSYRTDIMGILCYLMNFFFKHFKVSIAALAVAATVYYYVVTKNKRVALSDVTRKADNFAVKLEDKFKK
jgi:hypothetical protein